MMFLYQGACGKTGTLAVRDQTPVTRLTLLYQDSETLASSSHPFAQSSGLRIAIVGTGISGLTAAHLLARDHDLSIFEAADYIGGHTNTIDVTASDGRHAVDTGFIVFNDWTYPNFIRLIDKLGVAWEFSDMSFGVECARTGVAYCSRSLGGLFAQRRNLARPAFLRVLWEIVRFGRQTRTLPLSLAPDLTLGEFLSRNGYSQAFIDQFIIPMGAAIWSSGTRRMAGFPLRLFTEFLHNHGMLNLVRQPRWRVIRGGSRSYIEPLVREFRDRIRLNCPVEAVTRKSQGVWLRPRGGKEERFDAIILSVHSDQALSMLSDPTPAERDILSAMPYQANDTVLHRDVSLLPRERRAWASWNYHIGENDGDRATLTYHMNRLQNLRATDNYCVTLNCSRPLNPADLIRRISYHHPTYTPAGVVARARRSEISGVNGIWYCGAYWGNGFHEDGVNSALAVGRDFGKSL